MKRSLHIVTPLAALLILCSIHGCSENAAAPGPPRIVAGESRALGSDVAPTNGAVIQLDLPGDSLDGLEVEVPDGAYDEARTFRFSASPIESHGFGADFNPLTPLITIENGGGYSEEPMQLTIPCTIPDGHHAMAFVYDRTTGWIEALPTVEIGEGSITVLTRTFDFSTVASAAKPTSSFGRAEGEGKSEVVVSSIAEEKLKEPTPDSFRPGVDDWQFANYGSYLSPKGHCAGMSATAQWYYSQRKQRRGDPPLRERLDNDGGAPTPKIWQDDVAGYRFAGVAQKDTYVPYDVSVAPTVTYNDFVYAIRITKRPQFIVIVNDDYSAAHAMLVYKVENGILRIADPNYPGRTDRYTEFSLGQFLPYYSGSNANNLGIKFSKFAFVAESVIINTSLLNKQWPQVIDGTFGMDRYPSFDLRVRNEQGVAVSLSDGYVTKSGLLELDIHGSVPLKIQDVYYANEEKVPFSNNLVRLPFGMHRLGFHVTDASGDWVGFRWVDVESKDDATDPDPIPPSETGTDCVTALTIDGEPQYVTSQTYYKYPDNTFNLTCSFLGGFVRFTIKNFTGPATYELHGTENVFDGNTIIVANNGTQWLGSGTMTITRYDVERVAGTFDFKSRNGAGQVIKEATGNFQCNR